MGSKKNRNKDKPERRVALPEAQLQFMRAKDRLFFMQKVWNLYEGSLKPKLVLPDHLQDSWRDPKIEQLLKDVLGLIRDEDFFLVSRRKEGINAMINVVKDKSLGEAWEDFLESFTRKD